VFLSNICIPSFEIAYLSLWEKERERQRKNLSEREKGKDREKERARAREQNCQRARGKEKGVEGRGQESDRQREAEWERKKTREKEWKRAKEKKRKKQPERESWNSCPDITIGHFLSELQMYMIDIYWCHRTEQSSVSFIQISRVGKSPVRCSVRRICIMRPFTSVCCQRHQDALPCATLVFKYVFLGLANFPSRKLLTFCKILIFSYPPFRLV